METKVQQDLRHSPKGVPELGFELGLIDCGSTWCFLSHLSTLKSVGNRPAPGGQMPGCGSLAGLVIKVSANKVLKTSVPLPREGRKEGTGDAGSYSNPP